MDNYVSSLVINPECDLDHSAIFFLCEYLHAHSRETPLRGVNQSLVLVFTTNLEVITYDNMFSSTMA